MNKKRRGILLLVLGAVMILAGFGLYGIYERQDSMAGQNAEILLRELDYEIRFNSSFAVPGESPAESPPSSEDEVPADREKPEIPNRTPNEKEMPIRTLSGYDLIGVLRVPSVGIELPVLETWSNPLLNVAPCRYSGSLEDRDLILLGHDYKSHLQPLRKVAVGDEVQFTDVNGTVYNYFVETIEQIHESEPELLASEHPLIIFTCTRDGEYRIVVRCREAE